ncbi:hypothetical protein [Nitrosococcus watsonii]|uniref:Uncharacterized protein n=1 Tax=Nitrosococcus watsoni (strain C-113) TaxID=105559 RepID=D8KCE9_NITWC|nr:hypothetical protein [Nitrosococcus watsonii]ADJ29890.1 hypothetical protein Nwat_3175 [Nitrosococcus watsonii C-113]
MITELTPQDVVTYCRNVVGANVERGGIDDILLVGLLRRSAGIICPCSRVALRASVTESLSYLHSDDDDLSGRLDNLIEVLIVTGDLLELSDVVVDDPDVKETWVFAAPPSFVVRQNGIAFLAGIVPDQDSFLSSDLDSRIVYSSSARFIEPKPGENLEEELKAEGIHQIEEATWLRSPRSQPPKHLIDRYKQQLALESICGPVNGLKILDSSIKSTYYKGRWVELLNQTGAFIARRPQEFGAPLWCFVEVAGGQLQRVIDLPPQNYRWRGCDAAWHLQMAIDSYQRMPQRYRLSRIEESVRFDFFSPLPLWAQRRLMVVGREVPREGSLLSYEIPASEADEEEGFLQQNLWLEPVEKENR